RHRLRRRSLNLARWSPRRRPSDTSNNNGGHRMATDGELDFRSFTREQLDEALERIDREHFPLDYQALTTEIERRKWEAEVAARHVHRPRPRRSRHAVARREVAHVRASRHVLARAAIRLQPRLPGSLPPVARLAHSRDSDRGPPDAAVFPRAVSIHREPQPVWCHRI